jgi:hypothetical protein
VLWERESAGLEHQNSMRVSLILNEQMLGEPPPMITTSNGRASGRAAVSVLCRASSSPLHV